MRLAAAHPGVELTVVASTSVSGKRLDEVLPAFRNIYDLTIETFDVKALAKKCDAVIIGVPSGKSISVVSELRGAGARVLDLGGDFRLKDPAKFEMYYNEKHGAPHLLADAVYGLAPIYREEFKTAQLVCVPGCYPVGAILPLRPILDHAQAAVPIVIDSISGASGAGRKPSEGFHFSEMNENLKAYKLAVHQHVPEIEQELGNRAMVQFTPHVAPLTRGILTTITFRATGDVDPAAAYAVTRTNRSCACCRRANCPSEARARLELLRHRLGEGRAHGQPASSSAIDNLMGGPPVWRFNA